ncbi:glycosyl hydrolase family 8 [Cerasicoccus frondis]|uniref:glycosyl hydrolase family 8 n=1 Tax=Cerasicoccus frondis TaxID=490090 RepID=UPI00285260EC|nr:glycosyl hydrolase family 8 [Cerasicoccus frondis]
MSHYTLPSLSPTALLLGICLSNVASAQPTISNPGFDSAIGQTYLVGQSHADQGWYAPSDGSWTWNTIDNDAVAVRNASVSTTKKSLIQVITDGQATTGGAGLIFDVFSTDTGDNNSLEIQVYGVDSFNSGFTTGGNGIDANAVLLDHTNARIESETFNRTRYYMPVDFSSGYNYIVLKVTGSLSNTNSGSAVDNFEFIAPATTDNPAYPFPHAVEYAYGLKANNYSQVSMNTHVQQRWDDYKGNFITQSGATANGEWRVLQSGNKTTSEGIGYAMLYCVFMDNAKNNTRPIFDGLFNYYMRRLNNKGMMHWTVQPNQDPDTLNYASAADAEQDVALALIFADRQWGSEDGIPYIDHAKTLIHRIEVHICRQNAYDLLGAGTGSSGDEIQNISYYAPAWYKIFSSVTGSNYWTDSVIPACYSEIDYFYNNNTIYARGLLPDWHDPDGHGVPVGYGNIDEDSYAHGYEACRAAWRIGTDYLWNGTSQDTLAYDNTYEIADFMKTASNSTPTAIKSYSIPDGAVKLNYNSLSFTAPVGVAAMVSSSFNTWRNQIYTSLITNYQGSSYDSYFARSLQLFALLSMTGNAPNLFELEPSLVNDGGFEDGGASWSFPANGYVVSYNKNSAYNSARMNAVTGGSLTYASQVVPVTPNTAYHCSGYLKTVNLDNGHSARLRVQWLNSSGVYISNWTVGDVGSNDNYTYTVDEATSPSNASFARVDLVLTATTTGSAYFDDISLRQH